MKKLIIIIVWMMAFMALKPAQSQTEYVGYRTLATFRKDTVKYLQYNWGLKAAGVYDDTNLSVFFSRFTLPIYAVEFLCTEDAVSRIFGMRLYMIPYREVERLRKMKPRDRNLDLDKYSIFILFPFALPDQVEGRPLWTDIRKTIPGLQPKGKTFLPWYDSYKSLFGAYKSRDIQYNYEIIKKDKL